MTTHSPTEIQAQIHSLEIEKSQIPLASEAQLEAIIQHHAARVHTGSPEVKAQHTQALATAIENKRLAGIAWSRNGQIVRELAILKQELQAAELEQQQHIAQQATKDLQSAIDEFATQAKQLVRSYRRCQRIATRNHATGGQTHIPFDMSLMFLSSNPYSGFTLQQEMNFGPLPFEIREKEQQ